MIHESERSGLMEWDDSDSSAWNVSKICVRDDTYWLTHVEDASWLYVTISLPDLVHSANDVLSSEYWLIMLTSWAHANIPKDGRVKLSARRQKSWIFIEIAARKADQGALLVSLEGLLSFHPSREDVDYASATLSHALEGHIANNELRVALLGWRSAFREVPPNLEAPNMDLAQDLSPESLHAWMCSAWNRTHRSVFISGDLDFSSPRWITEQIDRMLPSVIVENRPIASALSSTALQSEPAVNVHPVGTSNSCTVRLLIPYRFETSAEAYSVIALSLALGGTHFSPLSIRLRDELGLSYDPSCSVEVIDNVAFLLFSASSAGSGGALVEAISEFLTEFLEYGSWEDHWNAGYEDLLQVFESSWETPRGRSLFISNAATLGVMGDELRALPERIQVARNDFLSTDRVRSSLARLSGVVFGKVDPVEAQILLENSGFRVSR